MIHQQLFDILIDNVILINDLDGHIAISRTGLVSAISCDSDWIVCGLNMGKPGALILDKEAFMALDILKLKQFCYGYISHIYRFGFHKGLNDGYLVFFKDALIDLIDTYFNDEDIIRSDLYTQNILIRNENALLLNVIYLRQLRSHLSTKKS
jgi:hypothetical protein